MLGDILVGQEASNFFSLTLSFIAHINEGGVVEMKYTLNTKYMYYVLCNQNRYL